ncbi:MAG: ECF transporter S component [Armatimonadota bacterium]|nr:ECF transporter S component [Armatimonadota bacterium]
MSTRTLARAGLMTAVVFVITRAFVLPIPQTKGFFNLGEAGIYLAALAFGPVVGALSGGVGSALADLSLGYTQYAPFTLIIKGAEGALVAVAAARFWSGAGGTARVAARMAALGLGGLVMVTGYFLAQAFALGLGTLPALAEVPYNVVQVVVGMAVGLTATTALERAVPRV